MATGLPLEVAKLKVVEFAAVPVFNAFVVVTVRRVDGSAIMRRKRLSWRLNEQGELADDYGVGKSADSDGKRFVIQIAEPSAVGAVFRIVWQLPCSSK